MTEGRTGEVINYGQFIGIFSENRENRLDIGTDSVKKQVPSGHCSWATMLKIKRLDGESTGPVKDSHLIGIFSQDERVRLDIGGAAVKPQSPDHESWATILYFQAADNSGTKQGPVMYGDLVGIFSQDGKSRLDIGSDAMKEETSASHDSWATRLRIEDSDPINDIKPTSITYDVEHATFTNPNRTVELYRQTVKNDSPTTQISTVTGTRSVTELSGWSDTVGFKIGVSTSLSVGIPRIVDGKVTVSSELSNTYTWNGSTATTHTWGFNTPLAVPGNTTYVAIVNVSESDISVPYTLNVNYIHESGKVSTGTIQGTYTGKGCSHDLVVAFKPLLSESSSIPFSEGG